MTHYFTTRILLFIVSFNTDLFLVFFDEILECFLECVLFDGHCYAFFGGMNTMIFLSCCLLLVEFWWSFHWHIFQDGVSLLTFRTFDMSIISPMSLVHFVATGTDISLAIMFGIIVFTFTLPVRKGLIATWMIAKYHFGANYMKGLISQYDAVMMELMNLIDCSSYDSYLFWSGTVVDNCRNCWMLFWSILFMLTIVLIGPLLLTVVMIEFCFCWLLFWSNSLLLTVVFDSCTVYVWALFMFWPYDICDSLIILIFDFDRLAIEFILSSELIMLWLFKDFYAVSAFWIVITVIFELLCFRSGLVTPSFDCF